jgi:serine/threonine protein kinase
MIGTTISHYKILEKIGEGGMGVVYKAQDTKLKRTVALKFLPPELLCDSEAKTRFLHEAQAASSLSHPNITTIYDVDEADQKCFISMEYVEGKSLQSLIYERPLRVDEILRISEQIAEGLKAAHRKEVVHRDIKSANVMVSDQGEVKIMDFGLAKLKGATKLTRTGTTLGTFQYMSPEQAQGKEVDCRSDIFSFGVVLYEMISQKLPFTGEHEAAIIYSVINERHEPLNQIVPPIPPQLERIVDKALAKDRDKRYQNMDELLSDLKEIPSTYPETKIITRRRKYPLMASISVLALVFLALLAYFVAKPGKKPPSGERIPVAQTEQQLAEKKKSLAVMYLENLSGDEKTDVVRAGLYEGITSNLSRISKLLIVPKKEILDFKDKKVEPKEIVDRTGAKYILSGTVQMIGQTIRLTMQLLDPLTNTVLWLDKYPCTEKELFEVQDKVAL